MDTVDKLCLNSSLNVSNITERICNGVKQILIIYTHFSMRIAHDIEFMEP